MAEHQTPLKKNHQKFFKKQPLFFLGTRGRRSHDLYRRGYSTDTNKQYKPRAEEQHTFTQEQQATQGQTCGRKAEWVSAGPGQNSAVWQFRTRGLTDEAIASFRPTKRGAQ